MSRPNRVVAEVLCAAAAAIAVLGTVGCEDAAAARRAEAHKALEDASRNLRHATVAAVNAGDEEFANVEAALGQIDRDLSNVRDGEPGQQAAAAILSAAALRKLGAMRLGRAAEIEADNRRIRAVLRAKIDVAQRLSAIVSGHEQVNTAAPRQWIEIDRKSAKQRLDDLRQEIAELSGPIEERTTQNSARTAEAQRLLQEADDLYRKAAELGHRPGLESYEEAVAKRREAEKIQYQVDQNEIDLDFDLEPEHRLHETRARHLSALIDSLETARDSLEQHVADLEAAVSGTQAAAAQLTQEIEAARRTLAERIADDLDPLYSKSNEDLERAAASADRAARGPAASAARLAAARVRELQGRLHWMRAQGLADHAKLLNRLNGVNGTATLEREIESARSASNEAIEQAETAYGKALESLAAIQGRGARREIDTLRRTLEEAVARLSGATLEEAASLGGETHERAAEQPHDRPAPTAPGAASPPELVQALQDADDFPSLARLKIDLTYLERPTPEAQAWYDSAVEMTRAQLEFDQALNDRFGSELWDLAAGSMAGAGFGMGGPLGEAQIGLGDVSGNRGTILINGESGQQEVAIVRIAGRWYFDGVAEFAAMKEMAEQQGMSMDMMKTMGESIRRVMRSLATRVRAGEFSSAQEVLMALGQAMMPPNQ